jgi:hypothetical protein
MTYLYLHDSAAHAWLSFTCMIQLHLRCSNAVATCTQYCDHKIAAHAALRSVKGNASSPCRCTCITAGNTCITAGNTCITAGHTCITAGHTCITVGHTCITASRWAASCNAPASLAPPNRLASTSTAPPLAQHVRALTRAQIIHQDSWCPVRASGEAVDISQYLIAVLMVYLNMLICSSMLQHCHPSDYVTRLAV